MQYTLYSDMQQFVPPPPSHFVFRTPIAVAARLIHHTDTYDEWWWVDGKLTIPTLDNNSLSNLQRG